jgi:glycosyltransferase involved in cell wall biosynthesis
MNDSKIIVCYRVKNEERFIEKSLNSIMDICDEIVILDDNCTDKTVEICSGFDKVVDIQKQTNLPLDEVRDRNKLFQMALKRNPDFVFSLDGDEVIMPNSKDILLEELDILYPATSVFEFQIITLWDESNQYRYDGMVGNLWHKRLIRLKDQPKNLNFIPTPYNGNLHCGSIPPNSLGIETPVRSRIKILHYGSYDEELRQKKYKYYNKIDPNNSITDNYIHMISGKGRFSGPNGIELRHIPDFIIE